jgi:hypothetical protein
VPDSGLKIIVGFGELTPAGGRLPGPVRSGGNARSAAPVAAETAKRLTSHRRRSANGLVGVAASSRAQGGQRARPAGISVVVQPVQVFIGGCSSVLRRDGELAFAPSTLVMSKHGARHTQLPASGRQDRPAHGRLRNGQLPGIRHGPALPRPAVGDPGGDVGVGCPVRRRGRWSLSSELSPGLRGPGSCAVLGGAGASSASFAKRRRAASRPSSAVTARPVGSSSCWAFLLAACSAASLARRSSTSAVAAARRAVAAAISAA